MHATRCQFDGNRNKMIIILENSLFLQLSIITPNTVAETVLLAAPFS